MTKLPQVSGQEIISALEKIGFYVTRQKGSHIIMRRDNPFRRVSIPNHKAVKKGTLKGILDDAGLTVEEFVELL